MVDGLEKRQNYSRLIIISGLLSLKLFVSAWGISNGAFLTIEAKIVDGEYGHIGRPMDPKNAWLDAILIR